MAVSSNKQVPAPAWLNIAILTNKGSKKLGGIPFKADDKVHAALLAKHAALGDVDFAKWLLPLLSFNLTIVDIDDDNESLFD